MITERKSVTIENMDKYLGNDEQGAVRTVLSLLPVNTPYKVVGHGQDNLIVLAEDNVYRFPRNQTVWDRAGVEHFVLEVLREHPGLPTPILKQVHENPAYTIATALEGEVLENQMLWSLPRAQQQKIGEQIGSFAATFHHLFNPDDIRPFLVEKAPQTRYASYLKDILTAAKPGNPYYKLTSWVLGEWEKHDHSESTVIHDDLHTHNMLFDAEYRLTGVLDFGDVNLGNPEQDLRYTYWMGDEVMESAVKAYEARAGRTLDRDLIRLCALSQEISGLFDEKRLYMHDRAKQNLAYRSPDLTCL